MIPSEKEAGYSFDNAWKLGAERLRGLEARFDPGTIQLLSERGVDGGWHCLEIGGGGGSIAAWLCDRVGPNGRVVVTDLDTRFLSRIERTNLEPIRHDVAKDELPLGAFDLVHARMVLAHIPAREAAMAKMIGALKPGGWLLCEDLDEISIVLVRPDDLASKALYAKVETAVATVMTAHGHDYRFGRRLHPLLGQLGLIDTGAVGRLILRHGTTGGSVARLTADQLHDEIVAGGLADDTELEAYKTLVSSPDFTALPGTLIAAWGRKPTAVGLVYPA
ncbi:MAG: methyltransferase domain-containing protein [Candidatus Dormibacteraceae bacterium]